MIFLNASKREWFSGQCLLIAFFFVFSFNHIVLTKYHFVLGQASFYFIALALLTSNLSFLKAIPKRSLLFFAIFLTYCLGSTAVFCYLGEGVCSRRPYTAAISLVFVFLMVQYTAYFAESNPGFGARAEKYVVAGSWALVILSIPDIYVITRGGLLSHLPYGLDFLSPLGLPPYGGNRLRAFTQEPSYLGMTIATLYPICFIRANEKISIYRIGLVIGLWICLIFSVSRTGLLACFILTFVVLLGWPKRLVIFAILLIAFGLLWIYAPQLQASHFWSFSWVPLLNQINLDASSLVRSAHIFASFEVWLANPLFGSGLGQAGFVLPQFYPDWYTPSSPEYDVWMSKSAFGGTPSFALLPKLLAEIGLLGLAILLIWVFPTIKNIVNSFKNKDLTRIYALSFTGFLLASFGVEGYLFLPAWLIFALALGLNRRS